MKGGYHPGVDAEPVEVAHRSGWLVVWAWVFSAAAVVPFLGIFLGVVGLAVGVWASLRRDYPVVMRVSAGFAAFLGLALAGFWYWLLVHIVAAD